MFILKIKTEYNEEFVGANGRLVKEYPDCFECQTIKQAHLLAKEARFRGITDEITIWENYGLKNEKVRGILLHIQ